MGCHTWVYKKIEDLTNDEYKSLREDYDSEVERILNDKTTAEDIYKLQMQYYGKTQSLDEIRESINKRKQKAEYYKNNIDNDPSILSYYSWTIDIDDETYINIGVCDNFRISNYPDGNFTSAKQLIDFCVENGWDKVYYFDENRNKFNAIDNIEYAKKIIIKIFEENPKILIQFG